MSSSEVARNQLTFEERAKYFKQNVEEFFNSYKNESGSEDCIEVCLIREGHRAVVMAEEEINRQKEEIESLKSECQAADRYEEALVERAKAEAYKEFAESWWVTRMYNKIKRFIEKIKNYFSHESCYNAMEQQGIAVFGMCSGMVGGDNNSEYLSCQCMDCPHLTLVDKE